MTRGEIEKAGTKFREDWEKRPSDGQLNHLEALTSDANLAILANAMYGMSLTATTELVKRLTERARA